MGDERSWWVTVLQWTLWAVIFLALMGWLRRSRFRRRPAADARTLVHPSSTLIVGVTCFVFFTALAVISNVVPNETTTWWTTAIFVGFAVLSVPVVVDYFKARHQISDDGLSYGRLLGRRGYLRWSDLRRVRYAGGANWFRLETNTGAVARISVLLMGLPELARMLLEHAPRDAIDPETLEILEATAAGSPPAV